MQYYGTRLSENISRREPEGYLLCLNVPVARTGTQEYLPEELGLPPGYSFVCVYRPEEEVFSAATVASFEGMPVTDDHPPDGVDVSNIRALQKGHAHNVRRGSGEESDLLLADLIITDPVLIDRILEGKREISCGYTYELCEENGQYIQRKIRGKHVGVVDAGRAGPRVSIKDEQPSVKSGVSEERTGNGCHATGARDWRAAGEGRADATIAGHKATQPERRTHPMKKSLVKKLVRMAKDGDPEALEALAELVEETAEIAEPAAAEAVAEAVAETVPAVAEPAEPAAVVETPEATIVIDEATLGEVLSRLDQIISLLTPAASDEETAGEGADPAGEIAEAVEEAVEAFLAAEEIPVAEGEGTAAEEISEMVGEILEPISEIIPEEDGGCEEPEVIASSDALRAALTAIRPALARLPQKQRRKVAADIAARLRGQKNRGADTGIYAALASAKKRGSAADPAELGRRIMASRNANHRKEH